MNDLEGQPDRGNQPKLLKGMSNKKINAYGKFEDELVDASREEVEGKTTD